MSHRRTINPDAVRAFRELRGYPAKAVAASIDRSASYYCNVEAGRKPCSLDLGLRIAHELGVPWEAISYPAADAATDSRVAA